MSDRWDFMERELDEEFERRDSLQREAEKKRADILNMVRLLTNPCLEFIKNLMIIFLMKGEKNITLIRN